MDEKIEEASADKISTKDMAPKPCPPAAGGKNPTAPYQLPGPQVEFESAYWLINSKLRAPTIQEIKTRLALQSPQPYKTDPKFLDSEIKAINDLAKARLNSYPTVLTTIGSIQIEPLSSFINLQNPPFGAIFNVTKQRKQYRVDNVNTQLRRLHHLSAEQVRNGRELARMFENETPGLIHQNALAYLLYQRSDVSPARHARIWAALNLTIYSALAAAWHYKWEEGNGFSFRQRPIEYDNSVSVLYDHLVADNGELDGNIRGCPCPSPGTPRHPAYPSGHSTYSAAASKILAYFFVRDTDAVEQLRLLAENIGQARLWAGVHWPSDHDFGRQLGTAVAECVIQQLQQDCVPTLTDPPIPCEEQTAVAPPTKAELENAKQLRNSSPCKDPTHHDSIPTRPSGPPRVF